MSLPRLAEIRDHMRLIIETSVEGELRPIIGADLRQQLFDSRYPTVVLWAHSQFHAKQVSELPPTQSRCKGVFVKANGRGLVDRPNKLVHHRRLGRSEPHELSQRLLDQRNDMSGLALYELRAE